MGERKIDHTEKRALNKINYGIETTVADNLLADMEIFKLDMVSQNTVLNFISTDNCQYTGKRLFQNANLSFINSGFFKDEFLRRAYGLKGEMSVEEQMRTRRKIEAVAMEYINIKGLKDIFQKYLQMAFEEVVDLQTIIKNEIIVGIQGALTEKERVKFMKMGLDLTNQKGANTSLTQINVYKDGGGSGLAKKITEATNSTVLDLGYDDE